MNDNKMKALLLEQVEKISKREIRTPRDFEWLSAQLNKMGERLSPTTLKRAWGYLPEEVQPRRLTLNILSRYLGYHDFSHFCAAHAADNGPVSNPVMGKSLRPVQDLGIDARVMLTWQPGRMCIIRHLGRGMFVVEEAEVTRLRPGNTFQCGLIIEGEPLYLNNLVQGGQPPRNYCCGMHNGVHYRILTDNTQQ